MISSLPHRYEARLRWEQDRYGRLEAPGRPPIMTGPPPQFDGSGSVWSPEELLLSAAASCYMATFMTFASKAKLAVDSFECEAKGTLDCGPDGFVFTEIVLAARARVPSADAPRAEQLMRSAKRHCIIAAALRAPVLLEASINEVLFSA